jgi:hypothetical protein
MGNDAVYFAITIELVSKEVVKYGDAWLYGLDDLRNCGLVYFKDRDSSLP